MTIVSNVSKLNTGCLFISHKTRTLENYICRIQLSATGLFKTQKHLKRLKISGKEKGHLGINYIYIWQQYFSDQSVSSLGIRKPMADESDENSSDPSLSEMKFQFSEVHFLFQNEAPLSFFCRAMPFVTTTTTKVGNRLEEKSLFSPPMF